MTMNGRLLVSEVERGIIPPLQENLYMPAWIISPSVTERHIFVPHICGKCLLGAV